MRSSVCHHQAAATATAHYKPNDYNWFSKFILLLCPKYSLYVRLLLLLLLFFLYSFSSAVSLAFLLQYSRYEFVVQRTHAHQLNSPSIKFKAKKKKQINFQNATKSICHCFQLFRVYIGHFSFLFDSIFVIVVAHQMQFEDDGDDVLFSAHRKHTIFQSIFPAVAFYEEKSIRIKSTTIRLRCKPAEMTTKLK